MRFEIRQNQLDITSISQHQIIDNLIKLQTNDRNHGLPTARGSGTNGFVQKNLAHVSKTRSLRPDYDIHSKPQPLKAPNLDIIAHQRKRKIEAKCYDLRRELEDEKWNKEEIDRKVDRYRKRKLEELDKELEHEKKRRAELEDRDKIKKVKQEVIVKKEKQEPT